MEEAEHMQTAFCSRNCFCGFGTNSVSGISKRKTLLNAVLGTEGGLHTLRFLQSVLSTLRSKIQIRYFQQGCDQMVKFKNFNLERVFCFGTLHQWCVKFLPRIFYPFWLPYGRKFRFGTLDRGVTKWYF